MKSEALAFLSAVQFLTRLPIPDPGWEDGRLDRAAKWFPLIGAIVGALCGVTLVIANQLGLSLHVCVVIAIVTGALITGALHEDGLADTADGIGGGRTIERRLAVMKDSSIGAYGALALMFVLLLRFVLYPDTASGGDSLLSVIACAFVAAHAASRAAMVSILWSLPYARDTESAKVAPLTGSMTGLGAAIVGITAILAVLPLGVMLGIDAIFVALSVVCVTAVGLRLLFKSKLSGWTGDTAGATQQVCEIAFLMGLTAWT